MTITAAHVEQVLRSIPGAYGSQAASLATLADGANKALRTAPPDLTVQGAAAFLATMSQESGSFRYLREAGSPKYLQGKPYWPYVGRTFEQITWRDNYADFGAWCQTKGLVSDPNVFAKDPGELGDIEWAWLGGVWYWQRHSLWAYGNRGDFLATQQLVNLGRISDTVQPAGYTARRAWYQAWLRIGAALLPSTPPIDTSRKVPLMATADAENVWINYSGAQKLAPGDNEVDINEDGDKTITTAPNAGVDLLATIDVVGADGSPIVTEAFFRVVSWKKDTPTTTISSRKPTTSDQVSFKGSLTADKAKDRSARLRLVVNVPAGVTGAVLRSVQISGWTL